MGRVDCRDDPTDGGKTQWTQVFPKTGAGISRTHGRARRARPAHRRQKVRAGPRARLTWPIDEARAADCGEPETRARPRTPQELSAPFKDLLARANARSKDCFSGLTSKLGRKVALSSVTPTVIVAAGVEGGAGVDCLDGAGVLGAGVLAAVGCMGECGNGRGAGVGRITDASGGRGAGG